MTNTKVLEVRTKSRGYAHEIRTINWNDGSEITKKDIEEYVNRNYYFGYEILAHNHTSATIKGYTD